MMMMTREAGLMVWLFGDDQFCLISFFYFIDMHPGEVNAIMARAVHVCLVDDWLVWHLILWLTVKDGVMGVMAAPMAALPSFPHPCISHLSPPLCSFHHLSIPSAAIYPSLSCFSHKCLLNSPGEAWFSRFKAFHCAKSHINGWQLKTSTY